MGALRSFFATGRRSDPVLALRRLVVLSAAVSGLVYLAWRFAFTGAGASPATWSLLLAAETIGLTVFAARAWQAWPTRHAMPESGEEFDLTVVVEATGERAADLRTTLVAVRAMTGRPPVLVVDQQGNRWLRTVAERVGGGVLEGRDDLYAAIARARSDWVLVLAPGDVPEPDLVARVGPYCSEELTVLQLAPAEVEPDLCDEGLRPVSPVDTHETHVVRPGLSARMSIPLYGDGPVLVRRKAVTSLVTDNPPAGAADRADRWWKAGIALTEAGGRIGATAVSAVRVQTEPWVAERALLSGEIRSRRLRTLPTVARPSRLGWGPALAHTTSTVVPLASAAVRVLQAVVLVLVLGLGRTPLTASSAGLLFLAVPAYGLRALAHHVIGRGRLRPLDLVRHELRTIGPTLSSVLPPPDRGRFTGRLVLELLTSVVVVALAVGVVTTWFDVGDRPSGSIVAVAMALAAVSVGLALAVIADARSTSQRRRYRRVRLRMVTCRVEEHEGFLVDISTGGVSVALPGAGNGGPQPGTHTTLAFRVPTSTGHWRAVSTLVYVVRSVPDEEGGLHLGLEFDDPGAAPLDAVAEFLATGPPGRPAAASATSS